MTRVDRFDHRFVEYIPRDLEPAVLYVSLEYATAVHACACGCGGRVVTPLSPTEWTLLFDGETVGLWPSVGNWSFACESHYWVRNGSVEWSGRWTAERIARGREMSRERQRHRFEAGLPIGEGEDESAVEVATLGHGLRARVRAWFPSRRRR